MQTIKKKLSPWQLCQDLEQTLGAKIEKREWNMLKAFNSRESLRHFHMKAEIYRLLRNRGHTVATEAYMGAGRGEVDVIDLEEGIIYEVESQPKPGTTRDKVHRYNSAYIKEIYIVDLKQAPLEIEKWAQWLKEQYFV